MSASKLVFNARVSVHPTVHADPTADGGVSPSIAIANGTVISPPRTQPVSESYKPGVQLKNIHTVVSIHAVDVAPVRKV